MFNFIRVVVREEEPPPRLPLGWRFLRLVTIVLVLSGLADLLHLGH